MTRRSVIVRRGALLFALEREPHRTTKELVEGLALLYGRGANAEHVCRKDLLALEGEGWLTRTPPRRAGVRTEARWTINPRRPR